MTAALVYVEIDIPAFAQTSPDSPDVELTLRFAIDTNYLPNSIPAIPSITDIQIQPATISLGQDLGQRASVTVTFRDHRYIFDGEDFDSGTFWGKFRARYGLTLQGNPFRLIRGTLGQTIDEMETRHFVIDSTNGPTLAGEYQIIAKDIFSLAIGNKAKAPVISNGSLDADITDIATTAVLSPAGIGNAEYPASGFVVISGREIVSFTRAADTLTITRGEANTEAVAHSAGARIQLCLIYVGQSPSAIINDLLVTYANIDQEFIPLSDWEAEEDAFLGTVYTTLIAQPIEVDRLIAELIEQAGLALWWDDIGQQIKFKVLRPSVGTTEYNDDNILQNSLEITEQPEKRISEVQIFFSGFNPLINNDEDNNYTESIRVADDTALQEYGSAVIKKIRSRWIPLAGSAIAETVANKLLGRFRDPPRLIRFELMRDQNPQLGGGYLIGGYPFQTATGVPDQLPIQIIRLNPMPDRFIVDAEEMLWTPFGADIDPSIHTIVFDSDTFTVNLRDYHDLLYAAPTAGDTIRAIVTSGTIIYGGINLPAFSIGSWPGGVTIEVIIDGSLVGRGGDGGSGGFALVEDGIVTGLTAGGSGAVGGTALSTSVAISLTSTNGAIWAGGGGGGGGGGAISTNLEASYGGGGGGGGHKFAPPGGGGGAGGTTLAYGGQPGTSGEFGAGSGGSGIKASGGNGGESGFDGADGETPSTEGGALMVTPGGVKGLKGAAIVGDSLITHVGPDGDIRGSIVS